MRFSSELQRISSFLVEENRCSLPLDFIYSQLSCTQSVWRNLAERQVRYNCKPNDGSAPQTRPSSFRKCEQIWGLTVWAWMRCSVHHCETEPVIIYDWPALQYTCTRCFQADPRPAALWGYTYESIYPQPGKKNIPDKPWGIKTTVYSRIYAGRTD